MTLSLFMLIAEGLGRLEGIEKGEIEKKAA